MTVETLLKVICSQKICNSGQAALSDGLCHGYLGRFSLKASLAVVGLPPPASGPQPRTQSGHLSLLHKGCLDPQGTATGGRGEGRGCAAGAVLCSAALGLARLLHSRPGSFVCPSWKPPAAILEAAAGPPSAFWEHRPPAVGSVRQRAD